MNPKLYEKLTKSWEARDLVEINEQKLRFIKEIKSGLGEQMRDINNYIIKKPSFWVRLKMKLIKIWSVF